VKTAGLVFCAVLLAACGSSSTGGTIVVPPPASPQPEPSALSQQPNVNHIHALAGRAGSSRLLVATHKGISIASPGASPAPLGGSAPKGDVLQVLYSADGTAYASGHNLGVLVSHDDGGSWAVTAPEVAGLDVHGLALDPTSRGRLYAYAVGKGILVSSDAGLHWQHKPGYADTHYLTGLTVTADGTLLAGTPDLGIAASTDHGSNFVSVRAGTGQVYGLSASQVSADVVIAATGNGIFLTADGGKNWDVGQTAVVVTGVGTDLGNPKRFFAGGSDGSIYTSTDGGVSWSPL
jgi:photosystem II stability/assembly factor-like uncharacterized protein